MGKRAIDPADIEALYSFFATKACETFNERKECRPQLACILLGEQLRDIAGMMMVDPRLVNALQENGRTKDALMILIRILLAGNVGAEGFGIEPMQEPPDAIVHVTEGWALEGDGHSPTDVLGGYEKVSDHPKRTEVIMVTVHTKERSYAGVSRVTGIGKARTATPGPLLSGGHIDGRLIQQGEHDTH